MKKLKIIIYKVIEWTMESTLGFVVFLAILILIMSIGWDIYWDNIYNN